MEVHEGGNDNQTTPVSRHADRRSLFLFSTPGALLLMHMRAVTSINIHDGDPCYGTKDCRLRRICKDKEGFYPT